MQQTNYQNYKSKWFQRNTPDSKILADYKKQNTTNRK